ncbi:heavy metal translocatin [Linnemannia elongata AG-77]|uniref:Heavy metal translocatin n=1 Tax=Linnemannia elongata AG-77 TaxID=1314771 RepID=A0A197JGD5_9FUNG|nr:heavy metal translocatin [Linnemannia elongata AG-77]
MRKITTKDSAPEDQQASSTTTGDPIAIDIESSKPACCTSTGSERESDTLTADLVAVPKQGPCCTPPKKDKYCGPSHQPESRDSTLVPELAAVPKQSSCCTPPKKDKCCGPSRQQESRDSTLVADLAAVPKQSSCCTFPKTDNCCGPSHHQESRDFNITIDKDDTGNWKQACFQVHGMTCTGCENTLNAVLQAHPSIAGVKSNMFLSKSELSYDPAVLTTAGIIDIIRAAGFSAQLQHSATGNQACFLVTRQANDFDPEKDRSIVSSTLDTKGVVAVDVMDHLPGFLVDVAFDPDVTGTRDIALALRFQGFTVELAKNDGDDSKKSRTEMTRMRRLLIISVILVIPVVFLAFIFPYAGASEVMPDLSARNLALFLLTTPIQLYVGAPIYRGAWNGLILSRELNMDSLVVLSTSCAYFYSTSATIVAISSTRYQAPEVFFETSAILMTLITLGRYLQTLAKGRAVDALSKLKDLQSPTANLVILDSNGDEAIEKIESGYLQRRDIIKILPSERIPADGMVVRGTADVDESNMTGESVPVGKGISDEVMAGSINISGTLLVRVTRVQSESKLNDITRLVEEAQASRAPSQAFADKIAAWFTPFVIALGFTTYLVWLILGLQGKVDTTKYPSGVLALTFAVAVLVVSCPCAIALAVPTVIVVGTGVGARNGILVKDGGVFEDAAKVTHVVFDKTGTLTQGQFQVVDCLELGDADGHHSVYDLAAAAASNSEHPLSLAVASYCGERSSQSLYLEESTAYPGFGILCRAQGREVRVGKVTWAFEGIELSPDATDFLTRAYQLGRSTVAVSSNQTPLMLFALADGLRPEAAAVVSHLKAIGLQVRVISGDHQSAVDHIARQLGIDSTHAIGDCTPLDKLTRLTQLQAAGHLVAFCGDGTNDAPVLAQAQVGVALGAGTSGVAIATAKVVLLTNDLRGVAITIDLARQVMARIRVNFAWAFLYNLVVIPLAAGCFVPLMEDARIPPALAGLGELLSVMPVLAFALLLKRYHIPASLTTQK